MEEDEVLEEDDTNTLKRFEKRLEQILQIKNSVFTQVTHNIKKSQEKQKKAYDTRHSNKLVFKIGSLVLLRNCLRDDRKGGWSKAPFTGPCTILKIQKKQQLYFKNNERKIN
ncbi:unnamed protein product [Macrosiphum euphorbiae]|uniref:Uncharacterized protein n=1 Tax=Macrosiphum euphorbiae TaxID=13131 RepID=A0AAV0WP55_9HEMI|nr:unnamed protein product [Macrosiphum euphorbiae]